MDKNINSDLIISEYTGTEKEVIIPEDIKWIEAGAFMGNKDIVSVYLPKTRHNSVFPNHLYQMFGFYITNKKAQTRKPAPL